jgi:hypothetical protein
MARIEIPEALREKLGPDMKMDVHWIDVKLRSGQVLKNLEVRGGRYITGRADDQNGVGDLPFSTQDIKKIRRRSFLPFW